MVALDGVDLRIRPGTVHALMGENGAGKSTLMKIIAGVIRRTRARSVSAAAGPTSTRRASDRAGIAMIHQELNLMPQMTVAENIWIGREPTDALGLVDHGELIRQTRRRCSTASASISIPSASSAR